ncbi:MAG: hypothetical protein HAW62_05485 [Endozoicomonadaceae bacterium]|nr:hypothetical protein [Endozoicomonadaceae bacterium]
MIEKYKSDQIIEKKKNKLKSLTQDARSTVSPFFKNIVSGTVAAAGIQGGVTGMLSSGSFFTAAASTILSPAIASTLAVGAVAACAKVGFDYIVNKYVSSETKQNNSNLLSMLSYIPSVAINGFMNQDLNATIGGTIGSLVARTASDKLNDEVEDRGLYFPYAREISTVVSSVIGGMIGSAVSHPVVDSTTHLLKSIHNYRIGSEAFGQELIQVDTCPSLGGRNIYSAPEVISQKFFTNDIINSNYLIVYQTYPSANFSSLSLAQCNRTNIFLYGNVFRRDVCLIPSTLSFSFIGNTHDIENIINQGKYCNCGTTPNVTPEISEDSGEIFNHPANSENIKHAILKSGSSDYGDGLPASINDTIRALPLSGNTTLTFPKNSLEYSISCTPRIDDVDFRTCVDTTSLNPERAYQYVKTETEFDEKVHNACCLSVKSNLRNICGCNDNPKIDLTYPDGIPAGNITEQDFTASFFKNVTNGSRAVYFSEPENTYIVKELKNGTLTSCEPVSIFVNSTLSSVCFNSRIGKEYFSFDSLKDLQSIYSEISCINLIKSSDGIVTVILIPASYIAGAAGAFTGIIFCKKHNKLCFKKSVSIDIESDTNNSSRITSQRLATNVVKYDYTNSDKGNVAILEVQENSTDIKDDNSMIFSEFKDRFSDIKYEKFL